MIAKRERRTKSQLSDLDDAIVQIVRRIRPCTVRQAFYQCVVAGLVPKDECKGYDIVQRRLVALRESKRVSYGDITDNVRVIRGFDRWNGLSSFGADVASLYRRDYWSGSDVRVEVWLEKDALAGVVFPVVDQWGLDLYVTRGFASVSYLQSAADFIRRDGRRTIILTMTDHDPSGLAIADKLAQELPERSYPTPVEVRRIAVTPEQIAEWTLPTRPTKTTDSRHSKFSAKYGEGSVELDAIPPDELRALVWAEIEYYADQDAIAKLRIAEESERKMIERMNFQSLTD